MKQKDFNDLRAGDKVIHKSYGLCTVESFIPQFGPCIVPDTDEGKALLRSHSGTDYPLLEDSNRQLQLPS